MSAIDDYGCDVDGCQRAAAELLETDDGARVLLCERHHDVAERDHVTLASGHVLISDLAGLWFTAPEPVAPKGGAA